MIEKDVEKIQTILKCYLQGRAFTVKKVWLSVLRFDKSCKQSTNFTYKELTEYIRNFYMSNKFEKNWIYLKRSNNSDYYARIPNLKDFAKFLKTN